MSLEPFGDKLRAFGLDVHEVRNGHNVAELVDLFTDLRQLRYGKPRAVILNTVKGKKVCECQFNPNWHTSAPRNVAAAEAWLRELWEQDGRRLGIPPEFPEALGAAIEIVPPVHANVEAAVDRQA
jgi:transketolase